MTKEQIAALGKGTMVEAIGIEVTDVGNDFVVGRMPVDHRTVQPFGLLHGGASAAFAETLGSVAGMLMVDHKSQLVVGTNIKCNHLKSVKKGWVYGKATPIEIGRRQQRWNIKIKDEAGRLICNSELTLAVLNKPART
jgi:1,4-dihydroxy-2-naphthoyl-CoA hydrolase